MLLARGGIHATSKREMCTAGYSSLPFLSTFAMEDILTVYARAGLLEKNAPLDRYIPCLT